MSAELPSSEPLLYYMQVRGFSGDMLLWWRKGRCGYTTDIKQAHVFTKEEADRQHRCRPTEDFPWRKDFIDSNVRHCISNEDVRRSDKGAT